MAHGAELRGDLVLEGARVPLKGVVDAVGRLGEPLERRDGRVQDAHLFEHGVVGVVELSRGGSGEFIELE